MIATDGLFSVILRRPPQRPGRRPLRLAEPVTGTRNKGRKLSDI
jgi:hypothetical protein